MNTQFIKSRRYARAGLAIALFVPLAITFGCANEAIEANRRQVAENQALIEKQQRDIAMIQAEQSSAPPPVPGTTGSCDKGVEAAATKRGGDAYSSGDLSKALGYYQDAMTACPSSSKAAVNLARAYETLDNRDAAVRYYRAAAAANDSDTHSAQAAKAALSRLGVH